jgi:hypothetical protein
MTVKNYSVCKKALDILRVSGPFYAIHRGLEEILILPSYVIHHILRRKFIFQGQEYYYSTGFYNHSWCNERSVEIPIVWRVIQQYRSENILEVGNVLSHYFKTRHKVVDKYEKVIEGITNQDIVDYKSDVKFDLIASISTIEHIGWDEKPFDPDKSIAAINHLRSMLSSDGTLVITIPIGHNSHLDKYIDESITTFEKVYCLKRITCDNKWIQVPWEIIRIARYGYPYPAANGVVIHFIRPN